MGTRGDTSFPSSFLLVAGEAASLNQEEPTGSSPGPAADVGAEAAAWASGSVRGRGPHGTGSESPGKVAVMLPCVAMGPLHGPVSSGGLFPLWASSFLKGTVK